MCRATVILCVSGHFIGVYESGKLLDVRELLGFYWRTADGVRYDGGTADGAVGDGCCRM